MKSGAIDREKLRVALRRLSRDRLRRLADAAMDMVPKAKLEPLVRAHLGSVDLAPSSPRAASILAEVKKFHDAAIRGDYYESFSVNSKNWTDKSEGTELFIAEHYRLVGRCVRAAAARGPLRPVREAFELLFDLLRRIDRSDDVIFLADERGSFQVGLDSATALPAYFRCLAEDTSPDDFAREVRRVIADFADYERPRHMAAARRVASAAHQAALRRRGPRTDDALRQTQPGWSARRR